MHRPLIIVGAGMQAELIEYHFGTEGRRADAFVLDPEYLREESVRGRPVLDFAEARRRFPPHTHDLFVSIGFTATAARRRWFLAARAAGYTLPSYVHPTASVAGNVRIGANTLLREQAVVCPFAQLGDDVFVGPHASIGHHARVGSHNFFASGAVLAGAVEMGEGCFVGLNATVRDRVRVGDGCVIGAGALIMADCAPRGLYRGDRTERLRELEG